MSEVVRIALALALLTAAALKLASPDASRAALATFGVPARLRAPAWGGLIGLEAVLAVTVAFGSDSAAFAAEAFCAVSAAVLVAAILRGRGGAPCGCFGPGSRVGWPGVARSIILAAGFAAVPWLPTGSPTTEGWLAAGLALAFACVLALGVAVLALAREVGLLRLRLGGQPALEIPDEGPAIGARVGLIERFRADDGARFALAVFSSDGCRLARVVATVPPPTQLGRPSIDGNVVVFHVATQRASWIVAADLAAGTSRIVRSGKRAQLTNPSVHADQLLFVRQTSTAQRVELGRLQAGVANRVLYQLGAPAARDPGYQPGYSRVTRTPRVRRAAGTLWTTALSAEHAYVTFVPRRGGAARASIVSIPR